MDQRDNESYFYDDFGMLQYLYNYKRDLQVVFNNVSLFFFLNVSLLGEYQ